ncbi:MAG: endo-1,4-beta-xylanase, partial [Planctomycetes bacterium]|nr:endo-1,4-beta-xylanase [Planctomycetota bacterium]
QRKMEADPAALRKLLTDHIRDEVGAMKGKCVEYDVYNEPNSHYYFVEKLGDDVMLEWFNVAHEVDPTATLCINEGGHLSQANLNSMRTKNYIKIIKYLQANKAPLGAICFESHFGCRLPGVEKVYEALEYFSQFGLPMGITEFDQVVDDEQLQADWQRDFMTIAFSHPKVHEFLQWGFWNGISKRGFINKDWSLKPNGKVWLDLVKDKWWTNANGRSGANGEYALRGFLGDYKVKASHGGKAAVVDAVLGKDGTTVEVILK